MLYANNRNRNKRIRALYTNKDGHSYIFFQRLTLRKEYSDDGVQKITQNLEISYRSCWQEVNFKEN